MRPCSTNASAMLPRQKRARRAAMLSISRTAAGRTPSCACSRAFMLGGMGREGRMEPGPPPMGGVGLPAGGTGGGMRPCAGCRCIMGPWLKGMCARGMPCRPSCLCAWLGSRRRSVRPTHLWSQQPAGVLRRIKQMYAGSLSAGKGRASTRFSSTPLRELDQAHHLPSALAVVKPGLVAGQSGTGAQVWELVAQTSLPELVGMLQALLQTCSAAAAQPASSSPAQPGQRGAIVTVCPVHEGHLGLLSRWRRGSTRWHLRSWHAPACHEVSASAAQPQMQQ